MGYYNRNTSKRMFLPFGLKIFISYLVLIIVPIFIFGYIANRILVDSYRNQMETNLTGTLKQIQDNISYKLEDTQRISDILYFDEKLPLQLMRYEEGWISYQTTKDFLIPKLRQTIDSTNRNIWMSVFLKNDTLPEIYSSEGSDPLAKGKHWDLFHLKRIEDKPWFKYFPQGEYGNMIVWRQVEDDSKYGRISLLRRLVDTRNPLNLETIGFIRISVYLSDIFQSIDNSKLGSGSVMLITDGASLVHYSSVNDNADAPVSLANIDVSKYTILDEYLPKLGWSIQALIPHTIIEKDTHKVNQLTLVICLSSFAVISIVAYIIAVFFSKRVSKVVSVLRLFQQGDFHKRIHYRGNDEFKIIAASLNKLGEQTEHLIEEVYVTNLKKKQAELETLQAQINPHFLYNTLSSISRLAKFGQVEKQHQMVMNLAKFYRLSLNEGQTIISIAKEVEQVQAYLDIQQVKYGDRMDVMLEIEPAIVNFMTVKLILQPFVENALEHAWCGDRIHIRIIGRFEGDCILFQIIDDGIGISKKWLTLFSNSINKVEKGYGIRNVNDRIKLYFGNDYGVQLFSRPGIGTNVSIRIPVQQRNASA